MASIQLLVHHLERSTAFSPLPRVTNPRDLPPLCGLDLCHDLHNINAIPQGVHETAAIPQASFYVEGYHLGQLAGVTDDLDFNLAELIVASLKVKSTLREAEEFVSRATGDMIVNKSLAFSWEYPSYCKSNTQTGGNWCLMGPDGLTSLFVAHFHQTNSPLFSNSNSNSSITNVNVMDHEDGGDDGDSADDGDGEDDEGDRDDDTPRMATGIKAAVKIRKPSALFPSFTSFSKTLVNIEEDSNPRAYTLTFQCPAAWQPSLVSFSVYGRPRVIDQSTKPLAKSQLHLVRHLQTGQGSNVTGEST
ncbi:hypothetical protein F4677DRAFT_443626 [Hypoxylon crocopeplum]|nr:hypothetical protein F4677DRAFT_443626 [Hypoxylon crocopeplum]